jgi:hypothetical protein
MIISLTSVVCGFGGEPLSGEAGEVEQRSFQAVGEDLYPGPPH